MMKLQRHVKPVLELVRLDKQDNELPQHIHEIPEHFIHEIPAHFIHEIPAHFIYENKTIAYDVTDLMCCCAKKRKLRCLSHYYSPFKLGSEMERRQRCNVF